jgi:hypothetical protein
MSAVIVKTPADLKCPSCGKNGVATIVSAGPGNLRAARAPIGFFVRLAPDGSMQIACSDCKETAHATEQTKATELSESSVPR